MKLGNYVRSLNALRGIDDVQERIRVARETGLTDDLWTSDLSESSFRRLANSRGSVGSAQDRRDEAEYRADKETIGGWWNQGVRAVGGGVMGTLVGVGGLISGIAGVGSGNARMADEGFDSAARHLIPLFSDIEDMWRAAHPDKKKAQAAGGAPRNGWQNVDRPMGDGPESINGSVAGSIPAGWRGRMMDDALTNQAMQLGWYGG